MIDGETQKFYCEQIEDRYTVTPEVSAGQIRGTTDSHQILNIGQTSARSTCVASLRDLGNSKMLWGYVYMNVSKGGDVSKLHMEISMKYAGWYLLNALVPILH